MTIHGIASAALAAATARVGSAAEGVWRGAAPATGDSVSLTEEAVRLLRAQREYDAAIELARTADELAQTALELATRDDRRLD